MKNLLLNPDEFFRRKSKEKSSLKIPSSVVMVKGLLAVASSMLIMWPAMKSLPADLTPFMIFASVVGIVGGLMGAFLIWSITAGMFYLISCLYDSEGPYKRTVEFVGYGYVPSIFSAFVALFVLHSIMPSMDFSIQDPNLMQQNVEQIMANSSFLRFSQIVGILCTLWSANIWIFALSHARNISYKKAVPIVCIPVGVYLLYSIYNLMSALT
jgi:hypothetical protein